MIGKTAFGTRFVLLGILWCGGCSQPGDVSPSDAPATELVGAGSTFAERIIHRWAEVYARQRPEVNVRYDGVGSGEGEARFLAGDVDFGGTDAGLTQAQIESVSRGAIQVPITAGIIVLAYHPEGLPAELNLPREVYADLFLGRGVRWNDPRLRTANPGHSLPDRPMNLVVRGDKSGTTFAMTSHLAAISEEWRRRHGTPNPVADRGWGVKKVDWPGSPLEAKGNSGVAALIRSTPHSIGYVQYGAARELDLAMASLQNKAGNFVEAAGTSGLETLLNAELPPNLVGYFPDPGGAYSYPIVTFTWLMIYREYPDEAKARQMNDFVRWCLTRGQDYAEAAGNVRLAPHIVRTATEALDAFHSGT